MGCFEIESIRKEDGETVVTIRCMVCNRVYKCILPVDGLKCKKCGEDLLVAEGIE